MPNLSQSKILLVGLAFLVTAGLGCKGLSGSEQQAIRPVSLEIWTIFDDVDALRAGIESYKAAGRPYLTVNVRQLRVDEFYPRLIEELARGRGPDIVSIRNRWLKTYQEFLSPLPGSVSDAVLAPKGNKFGEPETEVITDTRALASLLDLEREFVRVVKDDVVVGGKIYGLPLSLDTLAVYYNKDLLDRAGIPQPPQNWTEFQEAAKKITKYNATTGEITQSGAALGTGNNVPGVDDLLYVLFEQSGLPFATNSGLPTFNANPGQGQSPAMNIMNFYTDFANPNRDTYAWNNQQGNALDEFVNGRVGFMIGYSYHLPQIKARAPQLNFEVLPLFQLNADNPVNVANYWVLSVLDKSTKKNEAWGLIDYLTRSQANKNYLDRSGRPTALRAFISDQSKDLKMAPFVQNLLVAKNWYRGKNYEVAAQALRDLVNNWLNAPADGNVIKYRQELLNTAVGAVSRTY